MLVLFLNYINFKKKEFIHNFGSFSFLLCCIYYIIRYIFHVLLIELWLALNIWPYM